MERGGWKPHVEICPACPRCGSSNTKFCYYNNYSLTQPRYFCKGCRRYWTKGGSLRNVPVGGGCRRTRRGNKAVRNNIARHGVSSRTTITGCHSRGSLNSITDPTSYSSPSNNIDLAVVYANFLNQQPDQPDKTTLNDGNDQILHPLMPDALNHPGFEYSNVGMEYYGSQVNCATLSDWSLLDLDEHSKDLLYICGLEQKQHNIHTTSHQHTISNSDLPPLPGEEVIASKDNMVSNHNQCSNVMQFLGFESEADIDLDLSDRSEFLRNTSMLPTYNGSTHNFSRP